MTKTKVSIRKLTEKWSKRATVVQLLSHAQLFATPWTAARQASLSFTISQSLLKIMSMVSDAIQPSHPLSPSSPVLYLPQHQGLRIRWPKYWSLSFSISPSSEYSVLISFRINWFDLFAVWGTLKSLLQHHSLKALILHHSAFFGLPLWLSW